MPFADESINKFLADLSSGAPTPGGGAAAALCGALSCALVSMVANLTIGKEKYAAAADTMTYARSEGARARARFADAMDEDARAFERFMYALKMPKDTDEAKRARKTAMEEASKNATLVPLSMIDLCLTGAQLAHSAAEKGNVNVATDAGAAALFIEAAAKAAAYNVRVNLPGISDEDFRKDAAAKMSASLAEIGALCAKTTARMDEVLGF
ncbi:methenyltetrahydrofolate cyclohydrolase [Synergistales bacterium]|nr:methenyltetrahydrofolate cyclohydrolase [Synergistales bacterium]